MSPLGRHVLLFWCPSGKVRSAIPQNLIIVDASLSFCWKVERIMEPKPNFLAFHLHRVAQESRRGFKIG
jgi:hypothetical protein